MQRKINTDLIYLMIARALLLLMVLVEIALIHKMFRCLFYFNY